MRADSPLKLHNCQAAAETLADSPAWAKEIAAVLRELLAAVRAGNPAAAPASGGMLTLADLAEETGLGLSTLERLRARGELPPAAKIGRSLRFKRADVERWLASRTEPEQSRGKRR
jgi:excisionase family DNA binding protein